MTSNATLQPSALLHQTLSVLLRELVHGTTTDACWVLNLGDIGLLRSLDAISAEAASAPAPAGGASIAAHVDHLRYGFELLNRWSRGENPFADADYSASWRRGTVSSDEWIARRAALAAEIAEWERALAEPRELGEMELTGVLASLAHLAYHLGAIRQIDRGASGATRKGLGPLCLQTPSASWSPWRMHGIAPWSRTTSRPSGASWLTTG